MKNLSAKLTEQENLVFARNTEVCLKYKANNIF